MRIVQTGSSESLESQLSELPPEAHLWVYCGWDSCTPQSILPEILDKLQDREPVYLFERALHGPALSMMLTGVPVDPFRLSQLRNELEAQEKDLASYVQALFLAFWGKPVNVRSPSQMADFFYKDPGGLNLHPRTRRRKSGSSATADRKALESIAGESHYAKPLVNAILELKDYQKRLEFLNRGIDPDGRVRCTFSPTGTDTGRWSSHKNPWNRGGNFQNQGPEIREIYKPEEGYIFAYPDLKQAESYAVAFLSGDENYLRAVQSGDLHTSVAKLVWPLLPWVHDNSKQDRAVADTAFYRHFSHRETSKRCGHASNYRGGPEEISRNVGAPRNVVAEFQARYFETFPGIPLWHESVQIQLQSTGQLVTPLGRRRTFFGRLNDSQTLKSAIAYVPQSLISDILKIGIYRIWDRYEKPRGQDPDRPVKILADMHDGFLLMIRRSFLHTVPFMANLMRIPVQMPHGVMTIPVDFKVGWRWIDDKPENRTKPVMKPWSPNILSILDDPPKEPSLLDLPPSAFSAPKWHERL
jgi:DNA polymerase I